MLSVHSKENLGAFGLKINFDSADLILIPVPWEVTVSYGEGTGTGPELIREASFQLDFFNPSFNKAYNDKIHFEQPDSLITSLNKSARVWAKGVQKNWEDNHILNAEEKKLAEKVNQACESLMNWLYEKSSKLFQQKKIPALVGGEHSVSEGLIRLIGGEIRRQVRSPSY